MKTPERYVPKVPNKINKPESTRLASLLLSVSLSVSTASGCNEAQLVEDYQQNLTNNAKNTF